MPLMIGANPIIRTPKYLEAGKLYLWDKIKIFVSHFNSAGDRSNGLKEFTAWHFPQIQYKNPEVHCIALKNMTPTPFIRVFLEDGSDVIVDVDNKDRKEIMEHLIRVLGKPPNVIKSELLAKEEKENPANFGYMCEKHCICETMGQVPCPSIVPVPMYTRGKWRIANIPHKLRYFNYQDYDEEINTSYELIPRKPRKPKPKT